MHYDQLQRHGGLFGIKDENALEFALARPHNRWAYDPESDLCTPAAAYGYGLATGHSYNDGNKRVAFVAMYVFLGVNGWEIVATESAVVRLMHEEAAGRCDEAELATWLRAHIEPFAS